MKGTTIWAANIEVSKVVDLPSRIKGVVCQRKNRWKAVKNKMSISF